MPSKYFLFTSISLASLLLAGCASSNKAENLPPNPQASSTQAQPQRQPEAAQAQLVSSPKYNITGRIRFKNSVAGVVLVSDIKGLNKNAKHGFHIHEQGQCTLPDFKSAGGHFNPSGQSHGDPAGPEHHAGDLGNLVADRKGRIFLEKTYPGLAHVAGIADLIGKSVVIHEKEDDLTTQPTGGSGDRIACGVITEQ